MSGSQIKQRIEDYCDEHIICGFILMGMIAPILSVIVLFIIVCIVVYSGYGIAECLTFLID